MGETTYPGHGLGEDEIAAMASAAWHDHGEIPLDVAETIVESVLRAAWYQGYSLRNDNEISRLTEENERLRKASSEKMGDWYAENLQAAADALHKELLSQVDVLMDAKGGTPEAARLSHLAELVEAYEEARFGVDE